MKIDILKRAILQKVRPEKGNQGKRDEEPETARPRGKKPL